MTLEEKANNIITFNNGLPGFESLKTYVLEDIDGSEPFKLLKSTDDENIGFVTIVPFDFKVDYEVKLTEAVINSLKIEVPEDVLILNTVTLNSDIKKITTNLKAPIIINLKNNLGYQMILDRENYSIKHPLIKE